MAQTSTIEWTEATWNPVTGCSKISPGCKNCYAERMAHRLHAMGTHAYRNDFEVTLQRQTLAAPLHWRTARTIFVNSMSDLFHDDVPETFIREVFSVIREASWHQFQVLTKRSARVAELSRSLDWPPNLWMGVSVERTDYRFRVDDLRSTGASIRFLSLEPLLGPLNGLDLAGIDWVIVGGESGPHSRPIDPVWVLDIRDQCRDAGVAFFFKQWGGTRKKKTGRLLEGRTYDELPSPFPR